MASFTESDIRYIITEYRTLDELCAGRAESVDEVRALIAAGRLPRAAYVLPSGEPRFPPDYFALPDEAGGVDSLPGAFRARYLAAARSSPATSPSAAEDADEDWGGYLSGEFGVCLRMVTPETMVAKNRLIRRVEALVSAPHQGDHAWRHELRTTVDALDALERPFTDYDRERWGGTSREQHIDRVRQRFPAAFADGETDSGTGAVSGTGTDSGAGRDRAAEGRAAMG